MVTAFPPAVRFSGLSFSYNVAYAVFGGLTPPLIGALVQALRPAGAGALRGIHRPDRHARWPLMSAERGVAAQPALDASRTQNSSSCAAHR